MMKKTNSTKSNAMIVFSIVYTLSALLAFVKCLLQQSETYKTFLAPTCIFFILGLIIFWTPAEILLRIDRGTGFWLSKLGPFETSGFEHASTFYKLFGFLFMSIAVAVNIGFLFVP